MPGSDQHHNEGEAACVFAAGVMVVLHLYGIGIITAGAASASACKQHTQTAAWYAPQRRLFLTADNKQPASGDSWNGTYGI